MLDQAMLFDEFALICTYSVISILSHINFFLDFPGVLSLTFISLFNEFLSQVHSNWVKSVEQNLTKSCLSMQVPFLY